jgi:hypothetical protein
VKKDMAEPLVYAALLALLRGMRLPWGVALLQIARNRFVQGGRRDGKVECRRPGRAQ